MDIQGKREQILKELEKINAEVRPEDIKNASNEDLAEYLKLNLEIQRKLEILDAMIKK